MNEDQPVNTTDAVTDKDQPVTMTDAERQMRRRMVLIGIGIAVIAVLILLGFAAMIAAGVIDEVRDVLIILLATESLIIGGVTLFLLYQVIMLVTLLREELIPLIQSAQETVNSARGTTVYVSRKIIVPSAKAATTVARLQAMTRVLFKGK
jgi:membrane-anchored glycerophosphoryl diester phosphodiesterase (GDPDase)